ncbi:MAG: ribonuclease R [Eubacterium sp.]|nr:ribonuclease R [Eubacterium sp.]
MSESRRDKQKKDRRQGKSAYRSERPKTGHKAGGPGGRRRNYIQKRREKLVLDLISSKNYRPMKEKEIADVLEIPKPLRKDLLHVLSVLEAQNLIEINSRGRYQRVRKYGSYDAIERDRTGDSPSAGFSSQAREEGRKAVSLPMSLEERRKNSAAEQITETIRAYGLPTQFTARELKQADNCRKPLNEKDFDGRLDLRGIAAITIDGDDSKDMDDAVSLNREGAYWNLGVHIADVSNYVQANSALDREALKRGTSVYLCDRVIPMLPKALSNGICSLVEGEDRLTLSCLMKIDRNGKIVDSKIRESVICSAHRMTYSVVNRILTEDVSELKKEYADIVPMLFEMKELSELLRKKRKERGAIDFDFPETKFRLDESGKPVEIYPNEVNAATKLIEDFMLAANETVAKTFFKKGAPFLYRTHEKPDRDKMENALAMVRKQGLPAEKNGQDITPAEVEKIIDLVRGTSNEALLSRLLLRSMKQACYTTECIGHFGLAAQYYCHFTSPIRRYPDLQIHRIIKDDLRGRLDDRKKADYNKRLDDVAWKSSALERRATEAERETNKMKMAEYALGHLGEEYDAVISGVTGWGFYVELPNTMEGLVHILTLTDDYYVFDEENCCLRGRKNGREFKLGQPVRVRLKSADIALKNIDFQLCENESETE